MTGLELAILAGAGKAIVQGGLQAAGQFGASQDLKLTPEQKKRLQELERMQARNALGMTQGERELYRSQSMTPIQAAEREVMARFGAAQNIGDIGQGAAFRQQQALSGTAQAARGQVAQAVAQRDADVAQQQAEEKARLEAQQQQAKALQRQAALSAIGGIAEAGFGTAGIKSQQIAADEEYQKNLDYMRETMKMKQNMSEDARYTSQQTQNMLGIGAGTKAIEGANASGAPLGQAGNVVGDAMVANNNKMTPEQLMMMYSNPTMMLGDPRYADLIQAMFSGSY
jgi:hypothetical protein